MNEFEGFNFNDAAPEIQISVYEFDQERQTLYNWLALKLEQNVDVFTLNGAAATSVTEVAGKFTSSAFEIKQRADVPQMAYYLIADNWHSDERERNQRFSDIMAGTEFELLQRQYIDQTVADLLGKPEDDIDGFINGMYDGYFNSLMCDVTKLLNAAYILQENDILARTKNLPLSTKESTHVGVSLKTLRGIRAMQASRAMQSVFTNR